jgi:LPXTG-motif cell wall-anchored protein
MSRSILSRLGAGVIATALVAGGSFLAASPALAAGDVVTPNTVISGTWGTDGGLTVSGVAAAEGDVLRVNVINNNTGAPGTLTYLNDAAVTTATAGAGGAYSIRFAYSDIQGQPNDFDALPQPGDTPYVVVLNTTNTTVAPIFLPITVTPFAAKAQSVTILPSCIGADAVKSNGVNIGATGFGQREAGIRFSVVASDGTALPGAEDVVLTADATGSILLEGLKLFSDAPDGLVSDGVYTVTFAGSVIPSAKFTVGACATPTTPPAPAAVTPAAPTLANTGSSDAGILVGGSALLLLVGAALVVARRRQNAAA